VIVERRSAVDAPAERVWQRIVTPEGINDELRPWLTMSMPRGAKDLTVDTIPVGEPVGRCWMRLFGVLPFDYDDLTIAELWPGHGFHEESTMLSMRSWRHERTLEPVGDARTVVHDRLTFELRAPLRVLTPVVAAGIGALFTHRQRRLRRYFGG
jgi:ligand-binding SRPBCC domain-containing protein